MTAETAVGSKNSFNWRLLFYAAAGTSLIFLPFLLSSADFGEFLYVFLAVPIVSLALILLAISKKGRLRLSALCMLIVCWLVSAALVYNYSALRDTARWLLWAQHYQSRVLAQRPSVGGELKHTEWDSWGFAGADTIVYLVFDPDNSLESARKSSPPGKVSGIPCAVPRIRRLESHWYAVMFYTDASWDHCSQ